jgi:uncharacterized protein (DUF488 family)
MLIETEYLKGRKEDDFLAAIHAKGVNVVIDVRWWAQYPVYFEPRNLQDLLSKEGIHYLRYQGLGNPSRLRKKAGKNMKLAKKLYLHHVMNTEKSRQQLFGIVTAIIIDNQLSEDHSVDGHVEKRVCFICYCPVDEESDACHRFWLKQVIQALVNGTSCNACPVTKYCHVKPVGCMATILNGEIHE